MPRVRVPNVSADTVQKDPLPDGFWDDSGLVGSGKISFPAGCSEPRVAVVGDGEVQRVTSGGWLTEVVLRPALSGRLEQLSSPSPVVQPLASGEKTSVGGASESEPAALLSRHQATGTVQLFRVFPAQSLAAKAVGKAIEELDRNTYTIREAANLSPRDFRERVAGDVQEDSLEQLDLLSPEEINRYISHDEVWVVPHAWPDPDLRKGIAAVIVRARWPCHRGWLPKLQYVAAARSFRRRGIGSALIRQYIVGPALLEVHERNRLGMALYERLGFRDVGLSMARWRLYYRAPRKHAATRAGLEKVFPGAWPIPDSERVAAALKKILPKERTDTKPSLPLLRRRAEEQLRLPSMFLESQAGHLPGGEVRKWFRRIFDIVWGSLPSAVPGSQTSPGRAKKAPPTPKGPSTPKPPATPPKGSSGGSKRKTSGKEPAALPPSKRRRESAYEPPPPRPSPRAAPPNKGTESRARKERRKQQALFKG
eukprot:Hpha_TRINITY_DN4327_c0_g1::TRINITY_DN4327_c0_g1_i1::g.50304::m.50304